MGFVKVALLMLLSAALLCNHRIQAGNLLPLPLPWLFYTSEKCPESPRFDSARVGILSSAPVEMSAVPWAHRDKTAAALGSK